VYLGAAAGRTVRARLDALLDSLQVAPLHSGWIMPSIDAITLRRLGRVVLPVMLAALPIALIAVIVGSGGRSHSATRAASRSQPRSALGTIESPANVFVQDPYMGVSCHLPNSTGCGRLGLTVHGRVIQRRC
jgi:hypothetical protein